MIDTRAVNDAAARLMWAMDAARGRSDEALRVIDRIALEMQTLALDAAIEAAQGGQRGREWSVVSIEAQSLARRASAARLELRHEPH